MTSGSAAGRSGRRPGQVDDGQLRIGKGDRMRLHFETAGADPGIYYVRVEADGGGMNRGFDLALVIN